MQDYLERLNSYAKHIEVCAEEKNSYSKTDHDKWCGEFSKECQLQTQINPEYQNEMELMKENLRLSKELEEVKKEALFLKKAAAFFAKEID